jgi:transposase
MKSKYELILNYLIKHLGKRNATIVICLVLLTFGLKNKEIKDDFGTSWDSLSKYRRALERGDINPLFELKATRKQSELTKHGDKIMSSFNEKPPKTLREAKERIEKLTGLSRSIHRIRVYLKKRGLNVEP